MDDVDVPQAVAAWAQDVLTELTAAYSYEAGSKVELPDAICELDSASVEAGLVEFPFSAIQQSFVMVWRLTCSFMVDNTDEAAADATLKDFSTRLRTAALQDGTLGGRVPFISRLMVFNYANPFVEYQDGTRGREMTMSISVGELVEQE